MEGSFTRDRVPRATVRRGQQRLSATRHRSADVAFHRLFVANARFIGVLSELPAGSPLTEQIPALIQHDLQVPKSLTIGGARGAVRFPLEELVLLPRELVNPLIDRRIVHRSLLLGCVISALPRLPLAICGRQTMTKKVTRS